MYELILRGGYLIDPVNGKNGFFDIAVSDDKIELVQENIIAPAVKIIDITGYIVTPGLIDCHCHIFPTIPPTEDGVYNVNADAHMLQAGVVTAIDAGSCGWRDLPRFKEQVIDCSKVRVLAMLNIASGGMFELKFEQDTSDFNKEVTAGMAKLYSNIVVAIKSAHYWAMKPFDDEHPPWASVDAALDAAGMCGKPIMVDFFPYEEQRTYQQLLLKLRKGDIHTHMYAQQFPILDKDNNVNEFLFEARQRGVIFDLGHGAMSFWFRNAIPAFKGGFGPDTISSDLYMKNIHGSAINLLHVMSKYLCIGMSLEETIARVTMHPARVFNLPDLGNLSQGGCADIAVLKLHDGNFSYTDCGNTRIDGDKKLECVMTIRAGQIVYDPSGLSMPLWEEAPDAYWSPPGVLLH